jgi:acetyltransferase-like isoleucine patch superfamily enzyme
VTLGRFVTLNLAATVGHDVAVGDWSTLSGHVDITGKVSLGEGVFAGSHACVLPGLKVGDRAVVGAGTVVTRNVSAGSTMFGVPAKLICTTATK